jgi:hypothetical protein
MYASRSTRDQHRVISFRCGRSGSRRLAIETMESRLLLSGNQIDLSIWNLDESGSADYAQISDSTGPAVTGSYGSTPRLNDGNSFRSITDDTDSNLSLSGSISAAYTPSRPSVVSWEPLEVPFQPSQPVGTVDFLGNTFGQSHAFTTQTRGLADLFGGTPQDYISRETALSGESFAGLTLTNLKLQLSPESDSNFTLFGNVFADRLERTSDRSVFVFSGADSSLIVVPQAGLGDDSFLFQIGEVNGYSNFADADGGPLTTNSEGGEIPLGRVVSIVGENQPASAAKIAVLAPEPISGDEVAAVRNGAPGDTSLAAAGISGELARAVVFEVFEGETEPIVFASSKSSHRLLVMRHADSAAGTTQLVATAPDDDPQALALAEVQQADGPHQSERAVADAVYRSASSGSARSRVHPAAVEELAGVPASSGSYPADSLPIAAQALAAAVEPDASRSEAFSQLGDADEARLDHEGGSSAWLVATPLLAVLAAERLAARRHKQNEVPARPLTLARQ